MCRDSLRNQYRQVLAELDAVDPVVDDYDCCTSCGCCGGCDCDGQREHRQAHRWIALIAVYGDPADSDPSGDDDAPDYDNLPF